MLEVDEYLLKERFDMKYLGVLQDDMLCKTEY